MNVATDKKLLIFGATGTTGRGVTELALKAGMKPVLAGRNATELKHLSQLFGLEFRVLDLNPEALKDAFNDVGIVVSCIGPYTQFGLPVLQAAIANGAHYVDFTGEPRYTEQLLLTYDAAAKASGSVLVPSAGLGVCSSLAARVAVEGLIRVDRLTISYQNREVRASTGTARSMLEIFAGGAPVVDGGEIEFIRPWSRMAKLPGGLGVTFPLTDTMMLSRIWPTAHIESFAQTGPAILLWILSPLLALLKIPLVKRVLRKGLLLLNGHQGSAAGGQIDITVVAEGGMLRQAAIVQVRNMYELTYRAGFEVVKGLMKSLPSAGLRAAGEILVDPSELAEEIGIKLRQLSLN